MRIQNNITAINTHRQYGIANNAVASSAEKLSSGYRINRAGDDAAGLAISEKMRAQIRGLNMASKNSQDAISMVQTAEGALQSTHNVLQRMRELAVQSASDTNETRIDRTALNAEFKQLQKEIDDTAGKTRFNDQNLIDGSFAARTVTSSSTSTLVKGSWAANNAANGTYTINFIDLLTGSSVTGVAATISATSTGATINNMTWAFATGSAAKSEAVNGNWTMNYVAGSFVATNVNTGETRSQKYDGTLASGSSVTLTFGDLGTLTITAGSGGSIGNTDFAGISFGMTASGGISDKAATYSHFAQLNGESIELQAGMSTLYFKNSGISVDLKTTITDTQVAPATTSNSTLSSITVNVTDTQKRGMTIQTGANQYDELEINIAKMDAYTLGIKTADINSRANASTAITQVNNALNFVSSQRADLGALQNRLNYKIANLDTSAENLQAAESRIRDVDMAKEMTEFTKKNILVQASTAMLAQANQAPQNVLSLLR